MRLTELLAEGEGGALVAGRPHPMVTVVAGLGAHAPKVAAALAAALVGRPLDEGTVDGMVDVGNGEPVSFAEIPDAGAVDALLRADDLAGLAPAESVASPAEHDEVAATPEAAPEPAGPDLARLEAEAAAAEDAHRRASEAFAALPVPSAPAGTDPLEDPHVTVIAGAVAEVRAAEAEEAAKDPRIAELLAKYEAHRVREAEAAAAATVPEWLRVQARQNVEAATMALAVLTKTPDTQALTKQQVHAIEAAHAEWLETSDKASRALSGRSARRRAEEALAFRDALLREAGIPSWDAFVLAQATSVADQQLAERIEKAKISLADAEAVWDELQSAGGGIEHAVLAEEGQRLRDEAIELLGFDPSEHPEQDLLAAIAPSLRVDGAYIALRTALDGVGAAPAGAELAEAGERWLAKVRERSAQWHADIAAAAQAAAARAAAADDLAAAKARVDETATALAAARASAADRAPDAAGAPTIDLTAAGLGAPDDAPPAEAPAAGPPSLAVLVEQEIEARAAALVREGRQGAVPLVVDDAVAGLPDDAAAAALDALGAVAYQVQVLYLGEGPAVDAWLGRLGARAVLLSPESS